MKEMRSQGGMSVQTALKRGNMELQSNINVYKSITLMNKVKKTLQHKEKTENPQSTLQENSEFVYPETTRNVKINRSRTPVAMATHSEHSLQAVSMVTDCVNRTCRLSP